MEGSSGRPAPARNAGKCWARRLGAGCGGTVNKSAISFTVNINDIKDLARACHSSSIGIPIWVAGYRAELEPCIDGKSNDINDLASIRPGPEGQWRMKACSGTGASPAQFFRAIFFPGAPDGQAHSQPINRLLPQRAPQVCELEPVLATAGADYARHWRGYIASLCAESS